MVHSTEAVLRVGAGKKRKKEALRVRGQQYIGQILLKVDESTLLRIIERFIVYIV